MQRPSVSAAIMKAQAIDEASLYLHSKTKTKSSGKKSSKVKSKKNTAQASKKKPSSKK
jgi:hypothetical protein